MSKNQSKFIFMLNCKLSYNLIINKLKDENTSNWWFYFIGSHLIRRLLKDENNKVFNIDKVGYASIPNVLETVSEEDVSKGLGKYELLKIDLANQTETENAIFHVSPDIVIHLAA